MIARKATRRARIAVGDDERRRLIEDCAFFRAGQYREAQPGAVRKQDVEAAATDIDTALGRQRKRRGKR